MFSLSQLIAVCTLTSLAYGVNVVQHSRQSTPVGFISNGPAPVDELITIRLALASNNLSGLEQRLMTISNPLSPEYGQWLSTDEVKSFIQPSAETVAAVSAWAAANKISTQVISPNEEWIAITVPISRANALFDAKYTTFTHTASGEQIIRTMTFSFPSELVGHVNTAHPTTTFSSPDPRLAPNLHWFPRADAVSQKRQLNPSCNTTITPACLEALYGIPTTPATQGSTLLVTGYVQQFAQNADLRSFLSQFQPLEDPATTFTLQTVDRGTNPQSPSMAGVEANLDIEYTVGLALGVPVTFLSNGNRDFTTGLLDTATFLDGVSNPPTAMTTSYGENEASITPSLATQICNEYMALGARGISIIYASGDGGVRGNHDSLSQCASNTFLPVFPASCPFVTSVGSTIGIEPERAINFTGGGFSTIFSRPSYQDAAVQQFLSTVPSDFAGIFSSGGRGYPDVAMQGWNFEIVSGGQTGLVGGTSASSPSFASLIAMLNDRLIAAGKPVLGFLNPFIYSIAPSAFTDITIGKNTGFTCPSNSTAFTATTGWDPLTGFGTPVFSKLMTAAGL